MRPEITWAAPAHLAHHRALLRAAAERAKLLPALLRAIDPPTPPAAPPLDGCDERALQAAFLDARHSGLLVYWRVMLAAAAGPTNAGGAGGSNALGPRVLSAAIENAGLPAALGRAIADACPKLLILAFKLLQAVCSLRGNAATEFPRRVLAAAPGAVAALASTAARAALLRSGVASEQDLAAVLQSLRAAQAGGAAAAGPAEAAAPADHSLPPRCCVCGEYGVKLRGCGRCSRPGLRYCGEACQRAHWRAGHRAECQELQAPAGDAGSSSGN